jgi:hypothetical protein
VNVKGISILEVIENWKLVQIEIAILVVLAMKTSEFMTVKI